MTAARMGNVEMVKQLLANNARINEHGYVSEMDVKCMYTVVFMNYREDALHYTWLQSMLMLKCLRYC